MPATGAGCPATDQRGVKRPQGSACDIGAFEFATPQITITSPADGATYTQGSIALAAYSCSEGEMTSPIATCKGTVANGRPIDTSSTGIKLFTVTATDKAGNQTTKTINYTVTAQEHEIFCDQISDHLRGARATEHPRRPAADRRSTLRSSLGRADACVGTARAAWPGDAAPTPDTRGCAVAQHQSAALDRRTDTIARRVHAELVANTAAPAGSAQDPEHQMVDEPDTRIRERAATSSAETNDIKLSAAEPAQRLDWPE